MKTSCEFHFGFWDVTAKGDANFTASENQPFARIEDINTEDELFDPQNVATLESNFGWPLDGSKMLLPDDASSYVWGWWSRELSGEDLSFEAPLVLEAQFADDAEVTTVHGSAGITLIFYGSLPGLINIRWYGVEDVLLADENFTPDAMVYFCEKQVENYSKVVVTIPSMKESGRFLRVVSIIFGALVVIGESQAISASMVEEIDTAAMSLPINTLLLAFHNSDGKFALLDPRSAYTMFQWKQKIKAYKTLDSEKVYLGPYYLKKAEGTVDSVARLSCVDILGVLDTLEYKGGIYVNVPLEDLLSDILTPEGVDFKVDSSLATVTISGHLPIGSKKLALQQIAFAAGFIVDPTRSDGIRFYPVPSVVSETILPARKVVGHSVTLEELVTTVNITAHEFVLDTELKEISRSTRSVGLHEIKLDRPASVTAITGGVLELVHPNYCIVSVPAEGEVVLSGHEYQDVTTIHSVTASSIPAGAKAGVKSIGTATLVDPAKGPAVAQRVYDYYQLRYADEGQILPGFEYVGQRIAIDSINAKTLTGNIQRISTDITGGCLEVLTVKAVV